MAVLGTGGHTTEMAMLTRQLDPCEFRSCNESICTHKVTLLEKAVWSAPLPLHERPLPTDITTSRFQHAPRNRAASVEAGGQPPPNLEEPEDRKEAAAPPLSGAFPAIYTCRIAQAIARLLEVAQ